ncbi:MAG TPA: Tex-like N-terminal domain-containing protein [Pirellulales bacterium]
MASSTAIDLGHVAQALGLAAPRVQTVVELLDAGNTVPFITRYRKDQTGGMDEEQIRDIEARIVKLRLLAERKQTILRSIDSQGKLTPELAAAIAAADTGKRLEDLYLPYKPKKQTLATIAHDRGLEPLAVEILEASPACADLDRRAGEFVSVDRKVATAADALLGAGHILAEWFSERADFRGRLRAILERTGKLLSSQAEPEVKPEKPRPQPPAKEPAAKPPAKPAEVQLVLWASEAQTESAPTADPPVDPGPVAGTDIASSAQDQPGTMPAATGTEPHADAPEDPALVAGASIASSIQEPAHTSPLATGTEPHADAPIDPTPAAGSPPIAGAAGTQPTPAHARATPAKKEKGKGKKGKDKDDHKAFRDYFQYSEALDKVPPHRILAINRGERARALRVRIEADFAAMQQAVDELLVPADHPHADFLRGCGRDALSRLVLPSLEREVRRELTDRAESHAVEVFARNLRNLLLQPPVRDRRVLAIDPGFKSGCKLVAIDEFGSLLEHGVAHLSGSAERRAEAGQKAADMIRRLQLSVIAIGNGTGCRAAEQWVSDLLAGELANQGIAYTVVNEAGASVYSTSRLGREELPKLDPTVRGALSIGRRLQDPLSELVKIDAANIGVGMYQHDVKAKHLRESLDAVVSSCVNYVGVDVNTASPALLRYVSGLNQLTAQRLFDHRAAHGPFQSREQLKEVQGFGEATFVQAAGFLKIVGGANPLDATWIHPESYVVARQILDRLGAKVEDLAEKERAAPLAARLAQLPLETLTAETQVGTLTLADIVAQLTRPGRDPRESLPPPIFKQGILKLDDLTPGIELSGTVLNVVDFGAFVDIGLKDSGLVHISQLANRYVQDAHEVVSVGDIVRVWVREVDKERRRVSLTMIAPGTRRAAAGHGDEGKRQRRPQRPAQAQASAGAAPPAPKRREPQGGRRSGQPVKKPKYQKPPAPKPKPKPRPVVPLSKDMIEGKAPLRTFGDLQQFWTLKQQEADDEEKASGQ